MTYVIPTKADGIDGVILDAAIAALGDSYSQVAINAVYARKAAAARSTSEAAGVYNARRGSIASIVAPVRGVRGRRSS